MFEPEQREYFDTDGNPCTLAAMVRREPQWACSRIRHAEELWDQREAARTGESEALEEVARLGMETLGLEALLREAQSWIPCTAPEDLFRRIEAACTESEANGSKTISNE